MRSSWDIDYEVGRTLGHGAYGDVRAGYHSPSRDPVAIKRCVNAFAMGKRSVKNLLRELEILNKARGYNIVRLFDVVKSPSENDTALYIIMERVPYDLKRLVYSQTSLLPIQTKKLLYELLIGLNYLHSLKIVHRDLKPANVLVFQDCGVRICDFGFARSLFSVTDTRYTEKYQRDYHEADDTLDQTLNDSDGDIGTDCEENAVVQATQLSAATFDNNRRARPQASIPTPKPVKVPSIPRVESGTESPIHKQTVDSPLPGQANPRDAKAQRKLTIFPTHQSAERLEDPTLTRHFGTRWYRAPEVILMNKSYDTAVDMWAVGCILGELLQMEPEVLSNPAERSALFRGQWCYPLTPRLSHMSEGQDQLRAIIGGLGSLQTGDLEFVTVPRIAQYIAKVAADVAAEPGGPTIWTKLEAADPQALDLLRSLLQFNPNNRVSAKQALAHPYFAELRDPARELQGEPLLLRADLETNLSAATLKQLCHT